MPRVLTAAILVAMVACTPTFNWREITVEPFALRAAFPCKPEKAERRMPYSRDRELLVHALGCEAGGASYAVLWADVGSPAEAAGVMAQWKAASAASTHSRIEREEPFVPRGALALPQSVLVHSEGRRPDGGVLQGRSAYFARGSTVFQAMVFAAALRPEMGEPFFTGLRFQ